MEGNSNVNPSENINPISSPPKKKDKQLEMLDFIEQLVEKEAKEPKKVRSAASSGEEQQPVAEAERGKQEAEAPGGNAQRQPHQQTSKTADDIVKELESDPDEEQKPATTASVSAAPGACSAEENNNRDTVGAKAVEQETPVTTAAAAAPSPPQQRNRGLTIQNLQAQQEEQQQQQQAFSPTSASSLPAGSPGAGSPPQHVSGRARSSSLRSMEHLLVKSEYKPDEVFSTSEVEKAGKYSKHTFTPRFIRLVGRTLSYADSEQAPAPKKRILVTNVVRGAETEKEDILSVFVHGRVLLSDEEAPCFSTSTSTSTSTSPPNQDSGGGGDISTFHFRFKSADDLTVWYKRLCAPLVHCGLMEPSWFEIPAVHPRHHLPFVSIPLEHLHTFAALDKLCLHYFQVVNKVVVPAVHSSSSSANHQPSAATSSSSSRLNFEKGGAVFVGDKHISAIKIDGNTVIRCVPVGNVVKIVTLEKETHSLNNNSSGGVGGGGSSSSVAPSSVGSSVIVALQFDIPSEHDLCFELANAHQLESLFTVLRVLRRYVVKGGPHLDPNTGGIQRESASSLDELCSKCALAPKPNFYLNVTLPMSKKMLHRTIKGTTAAAGGVTAGGK